MYLSFLELCNIFEFFVVRTRVVVTLDDRAEQLPAVSTGEHPEGRH